LRLFPLRAEEGLGAVLAAGRRAALAWADRLADSAELAIYTEPQLDIVAFWPRSGVGSVAAVDAASAALLRLAMTDEDPVYLSTLRVAAGRLRRRDPGLAADAPSARILRSVLMKPEHERYVDTLHAAVTRFAREVAAQGA
jgi:hypothetical protein